jgi:hypothetical protein
VLEYLVPLKSAVDLLNGMLQLRGTVGDRAIFKNHITPAYENMAKVVDDYLNMFGKLETAKNGLDDEAVSEFKRDRLKLRGLRIQMRESALLASANRSFKDFVDFSPLLSRSSATETCRTHQAISSMAYWTKEITRKIGTIII